ncbi:MAG: lysoplasmalogenase [Kofleriaceae bacterium]
MIAASIVCALACGLLIIGEFLSNDRIRWLAKPIASLAFIAVGVFAIRANPSISEFDLAIVIGLALGAIGDVALLSEHGFLAGLGSFLLGHVAYVAAVGTYIPPSQWLGMAGVNAFIPIAIGTIVLAWLWPRLGKLRVPVIFYVIVIVAMVISAIAFYRARETFDFGGPNRSLFALGAGMFFASDLAVARDKFIAKGFINRAWGLPVYYAAQLLIAWSLLR